MYCKFKVMQVIFYILLKMVKDIFLILLPLLKEIFSFQKSRLKLLSQDLEQ